jgi:hypothetical protein
MKRKTKTCYLERSERSCISTYIRRKISPLRLEMTISTPSVLMADFLLSPEGAKILGDLNYGGPLKPTPYKLWYPEAGMSMAQYEQSMERWEKLLREIGRK